MATIEEQIKALEEEIFNTQKNKATEHHLGKIKAKIAKLKAQQELQKIKGGGGGEDIISRSPAMPLWPWWAFRPWANPACSTF